MTTALWPRSMKACVGMNVSATALIAAVRRRRALWDPQDVNHHNRVVVWGLWQEVGEEIGLTMVAAKSKWRGLRDYYRQQMRRNVDQPEDIRYQSSWAHFEEMSFLEGTMPQKREEHAFSEGCLSINETKVRSESGVSSLPGIIMKEEPPSPEVSTNEALDHKWDNIWVDPPQPDSHATYPKYPDSEVSEHEDDDLHFFKSLLPDVRSLSRPKKAFIRLRIQELIFKEVYGGENIDSSRVSGKESESG